MKANNQPSGGGKKATPAASKKSKESKPASFETDSQAQNRHGKGRQQNGSDGGHQGGRGMNH